MSRFVSFDLDLEDGIVPIPTGKSIKKLFGDDPKVKFNRIDGKIVLSQSEDGIPLISNVPKSFKMTQEWIDHEWSPKIGVFGFVKKSGKYFIPLRYDGTLTVPGGLVDLNDIDDDAGRTLSNGVIREIEEEINIFLNSDETKEPLFMYESIDIEDDGKVSCHNIMVFYAFDEEEIDREEDFAPNREMSELHQLSREELMNENNITKTFVHYFFNHFG